ncbi:MAG: hypothetical protein ACYTGG_08130 [Planctomycetota bacterium]|jgi:hypothetical protein
MPESAPIDEPAPDTTLACVDCGYDLRGLPEDGHCPECGTPIARSVGGDRLEYANPAWLARLIAGQALVVWGTGLPATILIVWIIIGTGLGIIAGISQVTGIGTGSTLTVLERVVHWCVTGGVVLGLILALLGALLLTGQDPRQQLREKRWSTRAMMRWGLGGTIVAILARETTRSALTGQPQVLASIGLLVAAGLLSTVAAVSLLRHLARLAGRVPDQALQEKTVKTANVIRWALPIAVVLPQFRAVPLAARGTGGASETVIDIVDTVAGCGGSIATIALFVYLFILSSLMTRYRAVFRRCEDAAAARERVKSSSEPGRS